MPDPPAIRIASPPIPPAARLHPVRPPLYRRQSRFTEEMAADHTTPVPSLYSHADETTSLRHIHSAPPSPTTPTPHNPSPLSPMILRGTNACLHGATCVILIAIMTEFLTQSQGHWYGKLSACATSLLVFLAVDTVLDVISLVRLHTPCPTWALLVRVVCGVAYLVLFVVYVVRDHVFPPGFAVWAMRPGGAGPLVYGVLWLLGVWSLAHAALRRQRFGGGLRGYYRGLRDERTPPGLLPLPSTAARRTARWGVWSAATAGRRDEEEGTEGFTPRVGRTRGVVVPLRERTQQRQRVEKRRQPSLHSTASTACDKGEVEEKGLGGLREKDEEEGKGGVGVPGRVVVKM